VHRHRQSRYRCGRPLRTSAFFMNVLACRFIVRIAFAAHADLAPCFFSKSVYSCGLVPHSVDRNDCQAGAGPRGRNPMPSPTRQFPSTCCPAPNNITRRESNTAPPPDTQPCFSADVGIRPATLITHPGDVAAVWIRSARWCRESVVTTKDLCPQTQQVVGAHNRSTRL